MKFLTMVTEMRVAAELIIKYISKLSNNLTRVSFHLYYGIFILYINYDG